MGDDPVKEDNVNSFTVAPIDYQNQRQGYIYAILGSEKISHITDVLQRSLIMKWSTSAILTALAFAFIAGLLLFFFLMRKLRVLSQAMQDFKTSNLQPDAAVEDLRQRFAGRDRCHGQHFPGDGGAHTFADESPAGSRVVTARTGGQRVA